MYLCIDDISKAQECFNIVPEKWPQDMSTKRTQDWQHSVVQSMAVTIKLLLLFYYMYEYLCESVYIWVGIVEYYFTMCYIGLCCETFV